MTTEETMFDGERVRSDRPAWRRRLVALVEAPRFQNGVVALVVLNAAIIALETSASVMATAGGLLTALDRIIVALFVIELVLRFAAHGPRLFRDPWGAFDVLVVAIALVPATGAFAALRALRVLRVLRLLSLVPSMRRVVSGLLAAIPGLGSIIAIMALVFFVSCIIASKLFAATFPELFGTLGRTAFTMFQIMTLEGWADIVRQMMEVHAWAWAFFLAYILIVTFTMLNLFIAVIVSAMEREHESELQEAAALAAEASELSAAALKAELAAIRQELQTIGERLGQPKG